MDFCLDYVALNMSKAPARRDGRALTRGLRLFPGLGWFGMCLNRFCRCDVDCKTVASPTHGPRMGGYSSAVLALGQAMMLRARVTYFVHFFAFIILSG